MTVDIAERMADLRSRREPFVHATVVRAQQPTSARPGDAAIVLADGTIEGFVGGQCAEGSVRTAALDALKRGETVLLRVLPNGEAAFPDSPGARVVVNSCLSGGALEIFLEPLVPAANLTVVGYSPVAQSLAELAGLLGFTVQLADDTSLSAGSTAVVIATLGGDEPRWIRAALDAGVPFVGLVASPRRGAAVLDELDLDEDERARVHTPVGLYIGARNAPEIAVSIFAEIIKAIRLDGVEAAPVVEAVAAPRQALDPVCGMTVTVTPQSPYLKLGDEEFWFCGPGCRDHYARQAGATS